MPSASVKVDHHGSQESLDPLQKISSLVDKKIRNLEKRKNKLEGYRSDLNKGKTLNEDQLQAVGAYDAVVASLELTREFSGQFAQVTIDNNKLLKKQMRKDQQERVQDDLEKTKEILRIQAVLQRMGSPDVRTDFLSGNNGAVQLTEDKLNQLDQVFKLVTPSFEEVPDTQVFEDLVEGAAEHMSNLVEGKPKAVLSTTYKEVRSLLHDIATCSYPENNEESSTSLLIPEDEEPTDYTNGVEEVEETDDLNVASPTPEPTNDSLLEEAAVLALQTLPNLSQISPPVASAPIPDNVAERVAASEGPPPGLVPPTVSPVPPEVAAATQQEALSANIAQLNACQPPPAPSVPTPGQSFFTQTQPPAQLTLNLHDLVPAGDFDFLQESQVQEPPNVYIDPAVVSLGAAVKPDNLVQLHEQQAQELLQLQQNSSLNAPEATQISNIQSQNNFNGQSYTGITQSGFSQQLPTYTNNSTADLNANPSQTQEKISFSGNTSSWAEQEDCQTTAEEETGWVVSGLVEEEKWGEPEPIITSSWAEEYEEKVSNNQNEYDRRGGFNKSRGNNRGGNNRGFRNNRGGGYGGGYQNGGNSRGGYGNGFRGRMNSMGGGFRGGRGGPRGGSGGGSGGSSRGGFRGRGNGFQGQGQRSYHQQQQGPQ